MLMADSSIETWKTKYKKLSIEIDHATQKIGGFIVSMSSDAENNYLRDLHDYQRSAETLLVGTTKKIVYFQNSLRDIKSRLRDLSSNKATPENIQTLLETFESRLHTYKNLMREEYEDLNEEEHLLCSDVDKFSGKLDAFDDNTTSREKDIDNNKLTKKAIEDRNKKDIEHMSEIGAIDTKVVSLGGRCCGWDSRDHDSFLRVWTQAGCALISSPTPGADGIINYTLAAAHRSTLLRRLSLTIPGMTLQDFDDHINKYLDISTLLARKKSVLSEWKSSNTHSKKQSVSLADESHDSIDAVKSAKYDAETRALQREKVARWKAEKESQELEAQQREQRHKDQEKALLAEAEEAKRKERKIQLEQWKEAENKTKAQVKHAEQLMAEKMRAPVDPEEAERRRQRDEDLVRRRVEARDARARAARVREDRISFAPAPERVEEVSRDPQRLVASTKAYLSYRVTPEELDMQQNRRATARAHDSYMPSTGRDLGAGRACPSWLKGGH